MEPEKGTVIQEEALVVLDDYSVIVADVTTKEGVSQIKTCARQIASVKIKVEL